MPTSMPPVSLVSLVMTIMLPPQCPLPSLVDGREVDERSAFLFISNHIIELNSLHSCFEY